MRFRLSMALAVSLAALTSIAAAAGFSAKGDFSAFGSSLKWQPDCRKPSRPFNADADDLRDYVDAARDYVNCANSQARDDADYAVAQIQEGRDDAVDDMVREVESLR